MSGPKVIRIVTEEEKRAICETQIASLTSAVHSLISFLEDNGLATDDIKRKYEEKLSYYEEFASLDNYRRIPVLVQREVEYIQSEKEGFEKVLVSQAAKKARTIRNLAESIKTLHMLSQNVNARMDNEISLSHSQINRLSEGEIETVKQKVALELSKLSSINKNNQNGIQLSDEQKELRNRLRNNESVQNFNKWALFENANAEANRFDLALAELDTVGLSENAKSKILTRLDDSYAEDSPSRRKLKLDSLMIEIAQAVRNQRNKNTLLEKLNSIKQELLVINSAEATKIKLQIDKAISTGDVHIFQNMLDTTKDKVSDIIKAASTAKGKEALINALSSLGYQIIEGMQTAVVENGQLIVKKPMQDTYGVQIQQIMSSGKFQLRMVSATPDNQRSVCEDESEETAWCSDLSHIQKSLSDSGVELEIIKALDPGATPVQHSEIMEELTKRTLGTTASPRHKKL